MKSQKVFKAISASFLNVLVIVSILWSFVPTLSVHANTPNPTSVTIAGSIQSKLGCSSDWDPACSSTFLTYDANSDVWRGVWTIPSGAYEYKAALNGNWNENYGLHAIAGGANIPLALAASTEVKFYYDHKTHWVTDNVNSIIASVPGSFQSELGCSGDWDPACLRSWLEDPVGDGIYTFSTTAIPAGNFEAKVAINEGWAENYGAGGVPGGANIPFSVVVPGSTVLFSYASTTHVLTITVTPPPGHHHDNNVEWDGLRHESRDTPYRTPGGAVPAGTPVTLRFRTFHNDVTRVQARIYDLNTSAQSIDDMSLVASDVSCYQATLVNDTCDFYAITLPDTQPDNVWYRFIISDGTDTAYYADDTAALDGGLGSPSKNPVDNSYALMVYDPAFTTPSWAQNAVIYQIFPDRFRNGRKNNDPTTGDPRYADPVLELPWNTLPEGFCRGYADAATNCPWRFGAPTTANPGSIEQPRGRDYFGGDLKGVDQNLDYLKSLGVNTLYFNPIFDSASNHGYDTQDYYTIDPYFGTQKDWDNLVKHTQQLGMRIILDGVYNHMSSDSPIFDRYHHYPTVGACESVTSPYRSWFTFHDVTPGTGTCVGTQGANSATYDGWFGFDSLPVLNKSLPEIQAYFLTSTDSVSKHWLNAGASGWRLDVMGDSSFPDGYWQTFRSVVKSTKPDALIIGELWQKDSTLLRFLRGDLADTTMNYRLRDAVVGLLASTNYDAKGFPDSGSGILPSQFAARLSSIREDYPDAAFYSLMNLVDSHDTARILWTLTPGSATAADKELNAANVAIGKQRVEIASLIQFTLPGAPTIYYGDEVGMTGNDDPDARRTYPWADLGGNPDMGLFKHYQTLASLRSQNNVLTAGDLKVLLADDSAGTVAYGRKTTSQAALVVINRGAQIQTVNIPVVGYLPDGLAFHSLYGVGNTGNVAVNVANGSVSVSLNPQSAWLLATDQTDLTPTAAPQGLVVTNEGNAQLSLSWQATTGAAGYNLYRSPVTGGGWVKVNSAAVTGTSFVDSGLRNAQVYFYVVTALDTVGNESGYSNEASGMPHLLIGWANLQSPSTLDHIISVTTPTGLALGQVWIDGVTSQPGPTPTLEAQLGFGPHGSNPSGNADWTWIDAAFYADKGNNDEYMASMLPDTTGLFDYVYRYSTTNGRDWLYADLDGPIPTGTLPPNPGLLTVDPSSDTTAPATPANLAVTTTTPTGIGLTWDAVLGDPTLYGYEVLRSDTSGGPYTLIARITTNNFTDTNVVQDATYYYVVRAVDTSFNRSGYSNEVSAKAELRTVTVTFNVTVPGTTDATGRNVFIAGTLDLLNGNLPQWNPGATVLTRIDATHWTITLSGKETTQIQYKYTLGDWDHVEKGSVCDEIANRQLTLNYGSTGTMTVDDTVLNWRNIAPCGP